MSRRAPSRAMCILLWQGWLLNAPPPLNAIRLAHYRLLARSPPDASERFELVKERMNGQQSGAIVANMQIVTYVLALRWPKPGRAEFAGKQAARAGRQPAAKLERQTISRLAAQKVRTFSVEIVRPSGHKLSVLKPPPPPPPPPP